MARPNQWVRTMINLTGLDKLHNFNRSISWQLLPIGLRADGKIEISSDRGAMIRKIWQRDRALILAAAERFTVPVELILATAATESGGNHAALRKEPGYKSDSSTPHRISAGVMQTLISTAQSVMPGVKVTRSWLLNAGNSYMAGTAYIARQRKKTVFDPPFVAAAYNAGGIYRQNGVKNRWKTRQYPIGTGDHVDRFVKFFNDCFAMFDDQGGAPAISFVSLMAGPVDPIEPPPPPGPAADEFAIIRTALAKIEERLEEADSSAAKIEPLVNHEASRPAVVNQEDEPMQNLLKAFGALIRPATGGRQGRMNGALATIGALFAGGGMAGGVDVGGTSIVADSLPPIWGVIIWLIGVLVNNTGGAGAQPPNPDSGK